MNKISPCGFWAGGEEDAAADGGAAGGVGAGVGGEVGGGVGGGVGGVGEPVHVPDHQLCAEGSAAWLPLRIIQDDKNGSCYWPIQ